jgi:hypothetical protein
MPQTTLEGPDEYITLKRAGALAGMTDANLRMAANAGRLRTVRFGRTHVTTRRWLHAFLITRDDTRRRVTPLPANYVAPEEEEQN